MMVKLNVRFTGGPDITFLFLDISKFCFGIFEKITFVRINDITIYCYTDHNSCYKCVPVFRISGISIHKNSKFFIEYPIINILKFSLRDIFRNNYSNILQSFFIRNIHHRSLHECVPVFRISRIEYIQYTKIVMTP